MSGRCVMQLARRHARTLHVPSCMAVDAVAYGVNDMFPLSTREFNCFADMLIGLHGVAASGERQRATQRQNGRATATMRHMSEQQT